MLLLDNFVHSDLHPGNIMIKFTKPLSFPDKIWNHLFRRQFTNNISSSNLHPLADDSDKVVSTLLELRNKPAQWQAELERLHHAGYIPELIFLDAGLIATLNATNQRNFLDLIRSLVEFDGFRAGQLMIERSRSPELAIDPEIFALKIEHVVHDFRRRTFSLGEISIPDFSSRIFRHVRQHHVKLEGDFTNTMVSILVLEGVGRQLDPDMDMIAHAIPILRQLGGQMGMMKDMLTGHLSVLLKVWMWVEARTFISSAVASADEMIKFDWCAWFVLISLPLYWGYGHRCCPNV